MHACMHNRHSRQMIKKLESAGLGFHVKANETMERLGMIQLIIIPALAIIIV